jgi:hypothetical protein
MYKVLSADFPLQQFPFNNFPLAILFPSKASHIKKPKAKSLASSFRRSFIPSGKQGGAAVLGEEHGIVTGET